MTIAINLIILMMSLCLFAVFWLAEDQDVRRGRAAGRRRARAGGRRRHLFVLLAIRFTAYSLYVLFCLGAAGTCAAPLSRHAPAPAPAPMSFGRFTQVLAQQTMSWTMCS